MQDGRVAIIDIGSNSIRLVVYERANRSPLPVFNEKVLCGLARGLDVSGRLHPAGVEMALANIERFAALARNMRVARVDLLATAAVRDAGDGAAFVARIEALTGLATRVISGEEEARLSGLGVMCGIPDVDGVMGDLGGGSLELVGLSGGSLGPSTTLPVGPLRLLTADRDPKKAVEQAIAGVGWLDRFRGRTLYPVGGAWRAFARLHMEQTRYPLHIIHHYAIPGEDARALAHMIASQSPRSLEKMVGVSKRRLESLPLAALALERLLVALRPKRVVFSAFGLREGFYFSQLPETERSRHPLIAFAEDEGAGWRRFALPPVEIFDWLTPMFAGESASERTLRLAACHLSDIAWDDHPDYRTRMACERVLQLPAPGMDHAERATLALAMAWRYESDPDADVVAVAHALADRDARAFARRLGTALRLAYNLSGGAPGLLSRIVLRRSDKAVELVVPVALRNLLGEVTGRRLSAVAGAFDLKDAITYVG
ncbi:MAG: Ppx/GppA family phosphatase [Rhodospirillales bacterium]|nr:MAG: Ppx/GppA family phosphatase [Rhodospirillales bacterium]